MKTMKMKTIKMKKIKIKFKIFLNTILKRVTQELLKKSQKKLKDLEEWIITNKQQ